MAKKPRSSSTPKKAASRTNTPAAQAASEYEITHKKDAKGEMLRGRKATKIRQQTDQYGKVVKSGDVLPDTDIDQEIVEAIFEPSKRTKRDRSEFANPEAPQWAEENAAHVVLSPKTTDSYRSLFAACAEKSGDARQALELAIDLLASDSTPIEKSKDELQRLGTRISREKRDQFNAVSERSPSKRLALERAIILLADHLGIDHD